MSGAWQSTRAPAAQELEAQHQAALQEREHAAAAQLARALVQANAVQARAHAETMGLAAEVRGASRLQCPGHAFSSVNQHTRSLHTSAPRGRVGPIRLGW